MLPCLYMKFKKNKNKLKKKSIINKETYYIIPSCEKLQ